MKARLWPKEAACWKWETSSAKNGTREAVKAPKETERARQVAIKPRPTLALEEGVVMRARELAVLLPPPSLFAGGLLHVSPFALRAPAAMRQAHVGTPTRAEGM